MNQQDFVEHYESQWLAFEALLKQLERRAKKRALSAQDLHEFPARYRRTCQQLALARDRDYAAHVIDRLNQLVLRGHQYLYESRAGFWSKFFSVVGSEFPRRVRAEWRLFLVASALLYLPTVVLAVIIIQSPDFVYAVVDRSEASFYESIYDPSSEHFAKERPSDSDFRMFGFYIRNNIGVGFRTFAGGMLFGLGSAFFLFFNGVQFGAIAGHLTNVGYTESFFSFVVGHGAFELTAIVLAGMAGLKIGLSLIVPGRRSRSRALREEAQECVVIIYGFVAMLVIAAFLEAFWSSSVTITPTLKFVVGAVFWMVVFAYLLLAGRARESE